MTFSIIQFTSDKELLLYTLKPPPKSMLLKKYLYMDQKTSIIQ